MLHSTYNPRSTSVVILLFRTEGEPGGESVVVLFPEFLPEPPFLLSMSSHGESDPLPTPPVTVLFGSGVRLGFKGHLYLLVFPRYIGVYKYICISYIMYICV